MYLLVKSAIVLCICRQSLAQTMDADLEMSISSTHSEAINQIDNDLRTKCSEDLECDQLMKCIAGQCQPKSRTSDDYETSEAEFTSTSRYTAAAPVRTTRAQSTITDTRNDLDFGSVPTTVWLSFAIPFISIMLFLIISGYIYRRIDKNRLNPGRQRNDCLHSSPAIIDNIFDETQRTFDSRIDCPPPSYDKVVLEMTELPPSYESLQNPPKSHQSSAKMV